MTGSTDSRPDDAHPGQSVGGSLPPDGAEVALPSPMIQHRGMYLPAGETHLQPIMDQGPDVDGRGTYQLAKLEAALAVAPSHRRRTALDIGAHVGLWSRILARHFARVEAFEPIPWHRSCWVRNMEGAGNATLHPYACSDAATVLRLAVDVGNSGNTRVDPAGQVEAQAVRLDDLSLSAVDLVKVDCEGWEEPAMRGMTLGLARWRPVVVVEQKPGHAERVGLQPLGAVHFLANVHGYEVHRVLSGDYIMVPPP